MRGVNSRLRLISNNSSFSARIGTPLSTIETSVSRFYYRTEMHQMAFSKNLKELE